MFYHVCGFNGSYTPNSHFRKASNNPHTQYLLNAFIPFLSTKLYGLRKIILFNLKAYFIIKIEKKKKLKKPKKIITCKI
jgi:hypothetical protein